MNYLHISCLFFLCIYNALSAPVDETFREAIEEKCPSVKSDTAFASQPLFQSCKNWKTISETNKFTGSNERDIRCLLYYQSFTEYCTQAPANNTNVNVNDLKYDLKVVCDYLKTIPHKNLNEIFQNEVTCTRICSDELGLPNSVCKISYYFANLTGQHNKPSHMIATNVTNNNQVSETKVASSGGAHNTEENNHHQDTSVNKNPQKDNKHQDAGVNVENTQKDTKGAASTTVIENKDDGLAQSPNQAKPPAIASADQAPKTLTPSETQSEEKVETPASPKKPDEKEKPADLPDDNINKPPIENDLNNENNENKNVNQDVDKTDLALDDEDEHQPLEDDNFLPVKADKSSKPSTVDESEPVNYSTEMDGDSYFFTYFMLLCIIFIVGYVCYHNKQKILALILEGRRGKRQYRGRRPNSANYHKLDSNLEEAINSSCKKSTNNVIY